MKPKYAAVYEHLLERISHLDPGDRLSSETSLAKELSVAPMTVRRALERLSQEGITIGIPGKGTFVSMIPTQNTPENTDNSLEKTLINQLLAENANASRVKQTIRPATTEECTIFAVPPASPSYVIDMKYQLNGKTSAISRSVINGTLFPDFLSQNPDLSLTESFRKNYDRKLYTSDINLVQQPAPDYAASLLKLDKNSVCPIVSVTNRGANGNVLELRTVTHHPESFIFTCTVTYC